MPHSDDPQLANEKAELRLAKERLELALEAGATCTWDYDVVRKRVLIDDRWAALIGAQAVAKELPARTLFARLRADDRSNAIKKMRDCLVGRADQLHIEFRARHIKGHWVWMMGSGRVVERAPNGRALRLIGINTDITARKEAEEALQLHASFLARLQATSVELLNHHDHTVLLDTIAIRAAELLDAQIAEISLLEGDDLVSAAHTPGHGFFARDRLRRDEPALSWRAVDGREPVAVNDYSTLPGRRTRLEGKPLHAAAVFPIVAGTQCLGVVMVSRNRPGQPFSALELQKGRLFAQLAALVLRNAGIYDDARRLAEARTVALRESEEKFRGVFDHSPVIITLLTVPDGRLIEANAAAEAALGFTREEGIGQTTLALNVWVNPAERRSFLEQLTARGSVEAMEAQIRRKDGSIFTALTSGTLITIKGQPYSLNLLQDITARKEAEHAREHLLALTTATLESTADGILVVNVTGRIQTFNRTFAAMWRLPDDVLATGDDDRLIGAVLGQLAEPEKFVEKIRALYADPLADSFDTLPFKDGRVFERLSRPQVVHGEPVGRVWSFRDVTARVQSEQALTTANRRASVLAQLGRELSEAATPRAAALATLEAARQLLGWDSSWLHLWNEKSALFEDLASFDLVDGERREIPLPASMRKPTPNTRRVMQEGAQLILRTDETDQCEGFRHYGVHQRSLSLMFAPLHRAGRFLGIFSIQSYQRSAYDSAGLELLQTLADHCAGALARIQARTALGESEERLRLVWESTADGMRLTDGASRILAVNDAFCRMMGKSRSELEGQLLTTCYLAADGPHILARHEQRFSTREVPTHLERHLSLWNGREVWFDVTNCFVETDPTHPLLLGIFRDITERKRAELEREQMQAQLRQAQKMEAIGTLAGGIAHDFNNILTGIFGFIELARGELPDTHPVQQSLQQVLNSSHRAKDLVRQILAFSRQHEGERSAVLANHVVSEVLQLLRSTLPAKVELDSELDPACPPILADTTQIHQIVMNLCTNAWHALPDAGGRIFVTLEPAVVPSDLARTHPRLAEAPAVCLSVADNGAGIDPAALPRIFEPFFTTKEFGKGTGLGLAVVHGIVGTHGGAIDVQSTPGAGTTFRLYFPALAGPADADAPVSAATSPGTGQHILWVDDDLTTNLTIRLTLEALGYRVTACHRAADAIVKFQADPADFALVLSDLSMPEMGGDELTAILHLLAPSVPMLVITGLVEPREKAALLEHGVREVLLKPLTRDELAAGIARHLPHA